MSNHVPQNPTAEKSALAILSCNQKLVAEMVWDVDLFHSPAHKLLFRAIESAAQAGEPGDFIAITSRLEAEGNLDAAGGVAGVTEILTSITAAHPDMARYYRRQLIEARNYRAAFVAVNEALPDLVTMQLPLQEFSDRIAAACVSDHGQKFQTLAEQMEGVFAELERREPQEAFGFGLPTLDRYLAGGIRRKQVAVVGAETGGGKSILLAMAALTAALAGKHVLFFTLEMPAAEILKRLAANLAGVPIKPIYEMPSKAEMDRISRAFLAIVDLPLTIVDSMASLVEIEAEARRLARLGKADLVVVDYVQLVANDAADNREQAISEIARRLKTLSLTSNVAVLTASQLNDDGKLRESRAIGQHSDAVLIISDGKILLPKNRSGQSGVSVPVTMRGALSRFEEGKP